MKVPKQLPHKQDDFKGYTLEELKYMRAYDLARMEIVRYRLSQSFTAIKDTAISKSGIAGKILGSLSYVEIGIAAYKIGSKVLKFFRRHRKKKAKAC